ncbi:MAG TPA: pantoate--beta-alanine ligase [Saprospiraceae bacterium]|nr:pantoate--beta-alanine ligase [Saprospiraceae bacterium]HMP14220.1 pantoate--beta-alanine ligase [Saprospiraceae bacterium]
MLLFKKTNPLRLFLNDLRKQRKPVAFIPTMGALHEGHLQLVRQAAATNAVTICSIFVNPTQFNDPTDLEKYPRTPHKDIELLTKVGCDTLFMPAVDEIYPIGQNAWHPIDFKGLDQVMEGAFRPGHFKGVAQVVERLLQLVQPDALYMGQKDFQQTIIVRELLQQRKLPVQLVVCPTVREANGLAMSSRNARLSPKQRKEAGIIYETLQQAKKMAEQQQPVPMIKDFALRQLLLPGWRPEYFEIVDRNTLMPLTNLNGRQRAIACTAVWSGQIRLIDNILIPDE